MISIDSAQYYVLLYIQQYKQIWDNINKFVNFEKDVNFKM